VLAQLVVRQPVVAVFDEVDIADDDRQRVLEVVGDGVGVGVQLFDEALALFFGLFALGDVADEFDGAGDVALSIVERRGGGIEIASAGRF